MSGGDTVADAAAYWQRYYAEQFQFGQGTENILAALRRLPPRQRWVDLGCGSESLLWSIGLDAAELTAVDTDPARLALLTELADNPRPRGAYTTALALCGHPDPEAAYQRRRVALTHTVTADCLTGRPYTDPRLPAHQFDLVTQFGLLGLCTDAEHFIACFSAAHQLLADDGRCAGANWVAADPTGRVALTADLYRAAAEQTGMVLDTLARAPVRDDPDFTAVWIYTGRTTGCLPHRT